MTAPGFGFYLRDRPRPGHLLLDEPTVSPVGSRAVARVAPHVVPSRVVGTEALQKA
jgi:hypothetical protein